MKKLPAGFKGAVSNHEELPQVYALVQEILGPDLIALTQFQDMHRANPEISHNIKRENGQMCGFLSLSFLNAAALNGLKTKRLTTMDLNGSHQTPPGRQPSAIYVGAVGAKQDAPARKATMIYRDAVLEEYLESFPGCALLSRPVTEAGMRIITTRGYRPLWGDNSGLGRLYIKELA